MIDALRRMRQVGDRHAGGLLLAGLTAIFVQNWRAWQQDRVLADQVRAQHDHLPTLAATPRVSVLVAAWNEQQHIDAHIRSFLALTYKPIELIVCAGGADDTFDRARRYAGERVIVLEQQPGEGKQRSLARCLEHATGDMIYLTDADCRYDDEALARLLAPLINEGEQAATGGSRPFHEQMDKLLPRYVWSADVAAAARSGAYSEGLLGRNAAVTRAALDRIGGLAWEARTGTDYHLARKLIAHGIKIRYVGASIVATAYPETVASYWHKQSRWMRNLLLFGAQYRAYHQIRATLHSSAVGAAMLAAPATFKMGGAAPGVAWLLLLIQAVFAKLRYVLFAERVHSQRGSRKQLLLLLPLTLVEFAIWVTPVFQMLHKHSRNRW